MDAAGIDKQVLLMKVPGVQVFEPAEALAMAQLANERGVHQGSL